VELVEGIERERRDLAGGSFGDVWGGFRVLLGRPDAGRERRAGGCAMRFGHELPPTTELAQVAAISTTEIAVKECLWLSHPITFF
jgi:hypothetical protein